MTLILVGVGITCYQRRREERRRKHALKQERNAVEMTTLLNKTHTPGGAGVGAASTGSTTSRRAGVKGGSAAPPQLPGADGVLTPSAATANHVPPKLKKANNATQVPNHHSKPNPRRGTPHGSDHPGRKPSSTSGEFDVSDLYDTPGGDGPTFRRYLDINNFNDDDSSPNPSISNQIPAIVTIETPHSPPKTSSFTPNHPDSNPIGGGGGPNPHSYPHSYSHPQLSTTRVPNATPIPDPYSKDPYTKDPYSRDPYARPDIVSGMYATTGKQPSPPRDMHRRLSLDTVQSEQSDVWKPMGGGPGAGMGGPGGSSTLPRHRGEPSRLYQWSDTTSSPVQAMEKDAFSYHRTPPSRRERKLQRSDSAGSYGGSGRRKGTAAGGSAPSPEIFYSRPNKAGIRQQHHPV